MEDLEADEATQKRCRQEIEATLSRYYPSINPASWYVLAAGDGDDMGQWLSGGKMKPYYDYLPQPLQRLADGQRDAIGRVLDSEELKQVKDAFSEFVKASRKRMGPATHSALSRALLDFSGQLVPYLTEQRYAGRLIYAGGTTFWPTPTSGSGIVGSGTSASVSAAAKTTGASLPTKGTTGSGKRRSCRLA